MNDIYAKIDMTNPGSGTGTVVNTQVMTSTDPQDPNFTWVDLTSLYCGDGSPIQIGCTYNGTNFNPPSGA
jgi:hypothetical protein